MGRLIDSDELLKRFELYLSKTSLGEIVLQTELSVGEICSLIKDCPTVDTEPVRHEDIIHCKECKYAQMTYDGSCKYCDAFPELEDVYFPGDFYCGFAKKKEEK